jgi:hypothetical protein
VLESDWAADKADRPAYQFLHQDFAVLDELGYLPIS